MNLLRQSLRGLRIAGAARVFPGDLLGESASLSNAAAAAELLGDDWQQELERREFDLERVQVRSGVEFRGWTRGRGIGALELAIAAGNQALDHAGWARAELNAVFVATCTPPHVTKNLAAQVADGLSVDAAGIDVRAGGAGGLEAWIAGAQALRSGASKVLVIASEAASHYANPDDLANGLLFGDGAGALALETAETTGGLVTALSGTAKVGGTPYSVPGSLPPNQEDLDAGRYRFQKPDAAYRLELGSIWSRVARALARDLAELDSAAQVLLPYAVNLQQLGAVAEPFGMVPREAQLQLAHRGCLGSAGALALVAKNFLERPPAEPAELVEPDCVLASLAVGGGVSWCSLAWLG